MRGLIREFRVHGENNPERFTLLNRAPYGKFNGVNFESVVIYDGGNLKIMLAIKLIPEKEFRRIRSADIDRYNKLLEQTRRICTDQIALLKTFDPVEPPKSSDPSQKMKASQRVTIEIGQLLALIEASDEDNNDTE